MFWDELVRRVRRERGGLDPRLLAAAGGHVAVYPAPIRLRRRGWIAALVALLVVLALFIFASDVRAVLAAFGL